ncbi:MAG TPA: phosphate acetyltransferase [Candidatus Ornithomonoglobus intestinigallinarum]|uniref:Phosphate acetyltransferase n=1 Tax=Candidatus Ornithomonoglobus intestinigallinarum TaxID=2840894 RepID=A0A9D1KPJ6_9FIRM|nr:phosphate acetyltransferase [Candidatus Ornithomonoglobus intestinigallinarum]
MSSTFIEHLKARAKADLKTIVLAEGEELRTIKAAEIALKEGYAKIKLVGDPDKINLMAKEEGVDISGAEIVNPEASEKAAEYANAFYELRKNKGMTPELAAETIKNPLYFGVMMVKSGDADGMVAGAVNSSANVIRPSLQILKTAPGTKLVSAFFVLNVPNCEYGENGTFIFADSALNQDPDADQISEIAISSAASFKQLVEAEPKIAMLSHSTYGSAKHALVDKMREATKLAQEKRPDLMIDGELQLDAAIVESVGNQKAPGSKVAGKANVLIFPNLDAGNIGYKLVQRLAKAEAYGPVLQGIAKPVNDLSRGCTAEDIAGVIAITSIQAQG